MPLLAAEWVLALEQELEMVLAAFKWKRKKNTTVRNNENETLSSSLHPCNFSAHTLGVGLCVGALVGIGVGNGVGANVGCSVGLAVGGKVGNFVGAGLGL